MEHIQYTVKIRNGMFSKEAYEFVDQLEQAGQRHFLAGFFALGFILDMEILLISPVFCLQRSVFYPFGGSDQRTGGEGS